jgi:kinesin family protein C2/C3
MGDAAGIGPEIILKALAAWPADWGVCVVMGDVGAMRRATEGSVGLLERYKKEMKERRRLFNLVQELRGNIRVYCRIRPIHAAEVAAGERDAVGFPGEGELSIVSSKKALKVFEFDQIFRPEVATEGVYREVEGLVQSTLDGYNVCIFAYGQTGSGKTFTMEGNPSNLGVNYRSLDSLFALRDERVRDGWAFSISVSLLEIYNEEILDMLAERGPDGASAGGNLSVRETKEGMAVPGLVMEAVTCRDDVVAIMKRGYKNRTTFATNMNEHSSRSHAMLSVYVRGSNATLGTVQVGKLHLVDLAG